MVEHILSTSRRVAWLPTTPTIPHMDEPSRVLLAAIGRRVPRKVFLFQPPTDRMNTPVLRTSVPVRLNELAIQSLPTICTWLEPGPHYFREAQANRLRREVRPPGFHLRWLPESSYPKRRLQSLPRAGPRTTMAKQPGRITEIRRKHLCDSRSRSHDLASSVW